VIHKSYDHEADFSSIHTFRRVFYTRIGLTQSKERGRAVLGDQGRAKDRGSAVPRANQVQEFHSSRLVVVEAAENR
jgi:hypothetical protein